MELIIMTETTRKPLKIVENDLFPDITIHALGTAVRIGQEDGELWINLFEVPKLAKALLDIYDGATRKR